MSKNIVRVVKIFRTGLDYNEEVKKRSKISAQDKAISGNSRYDGQDGKQTKISKKIINKNVSSWSSLEVKFLV